MGGTSPWRGRVLIVYRTCPYLSSNPNPLGVDKNFIIKTCFESFKKGSSGFEVKIINDSVDGSIFEGYEIIQGKVGNIESFHQQLDIACQLDNHEKVMLVEDDYLWVEGAAAKIERALDELDIISPYDHPGHYREERFKHNPKRMVLIDDQTYRECPSNTLTFATKAYVIKQNIDLIKSFGIRDHELFSSLPHDMYCPVPSLATHLVEGLLAPNVCWNLQTS
jgi:hypothetical protein